jgi:Lhr-like helicase
VQPPLPKQFVAGVNAVIATSSLTLGIKETPADAVIALNAHGGSL